jgi:ribosomal protein S12 methylthiotransferase accessory factor
MIGWRDGRPGQPGSAKRTRGLSARARSGSAFELLQSQGGLFGSVEYVQTPGLEPRFISRMAGLGHIGGLAAGASARVHGSRCTGAAAGGGTDIDGERALFLAVAEGLERYAASTYRADQFVRAPGADLGASALDLDSIPKCSQQELSSQFCPLSLPTKREPIRWVRGISLLDGRLTYLPAVMVYLHIRPETRAERIWLPISTGCAAHETYENALVHAILEVVERDAISLVWLQELELPRIEIDDPSLIGPCWDRLERSSRDLEYAFFDATTDLGFPTIYALQVTRADRLATTLVSCATDLSASAAIAKVIRDMAAVREAFREPRHVPANRAEFSDVFHGATYMARSEHSGAFDFLLRSKARRRLTEMVSPVSPGSDSLHFVLERLRQKRLEAFAVDLTTDEAIRSGFRVVRAIIPGLQPLSFHHSARYLAHPRLYAAPRLMGHPVRGEEGLNGWPQPFA